MKIRAEVIPFSSVVGTGVILVNEANQVLATMPLVGFEPDPDVPPLDREAWKKASMAFARKLADAVNAGQAESQVTHTKKGTTYDVVASKALFQVSNTPIHNERKVRAIQDGDEVTVYRNEHGTFVRFPDEMVSPRFEPVP